MILGVGNELLGDDGIGPWIARNIDGKKGWKGIAAGTAPENFTSLIRREKPDILVIVDATDMGLEPGEVKAIPLDKIPRLTYFTTHTLSVTFLIDSIKEDVKNIVFIGIQPKAIALGCPLSREVVDSASRLINILLSDNFLKDITSL